MGIQPPSSSSSRVRPRPAAASAAPQQRPTVVSSNASDARPAHPVPLESVVIRPTSELHPPRPAKGVATNARGSGGNGVSREGEAKSTSVRVCVRLRPLLSADFTHGTNNVNNGNDAEQRTPRKTGGSGFARDTASSHRHATPRKAPGSQIPGPMKRHTSGLATPTSTANNNKHSTAAQRKQLSSAQEMQPSWQTHPSDKRRITQSSHTTAHTAHHDPDRLADYTFDRVYAPNEDTGRLYEESIRGVVGSVVEGFHGSVFAYGQTNSGKTHTMSGTPNEPGVVRLAVRDVFDRIQSQTSGNTNNGEGGEDEGGAREYLVRVSYLEIYNEQIYDLLAPQSSSPGRFKSSLQHHHLPPSTAVRIFESRTEGVVVRGLREEIVTCPEDVFALLDVGDAKRKVGSTGMNKTSSRSHSVFRLVLESRRASRGGGGSNIGGVPQLVPSSNSSLNSDTDSVASRSSVSQSLGTAVKGPVRISSLSLVDLAGSESVKATGSTGVRQKEGQYINKSLLTLGHVVHKLSEMGAREEKLKGGGGLPPPKEHIPYRDSKLTRLLQPSLGGNAQVTIICNVSPALSNLEESHNTLKFAMRAKKIQQRARITEVADEKTLLRSYREEIEELKRQLKEARRSAAAAQERVQQSSRKEDRLDASSSDEEDNDDAHVLVSAIANLESLILKAGSRSTRKATVADGPGAAGGAAEGGDESSLPRALDTALMKAESELSSEMETLEVSSPAAGAMDRSLATQTSTMQQHDGEVDGGLLEELHRIQGMLGSVMKKKRSKGAKSPATANRTPERDAEVERLRLQLQEREAASTMREADASFLQGQLNEKEEILKEVSVLLEALEKRQRDLEQENRQLRSDLAEAANLVEEGDATRRELEKKLAEREAQLEEKDDVVFVEHKMASSPDTERTPDVSYHSNGLYHI